MGAERRVSVEARPRGHGRLRRIGWSVGLSLLLSIAGALGCGGGGESSSSAAPPPSSSTQHSGTATTAPASGSFSPGPSGGGGGGSFGGGGGGGFVSGGGGGGGGGGRHAHLGDPMHLGGVAGMLQRREAARQARIEKAHRPPGPSRLTGLTDTEQRHADLISAARAASPTYRVDDDSCERAWAQHVAFERSLHETRADGLMPTDAQLAARRRAFLTSCHRSPEAAQQCLDADYAAAHRQECTDDATAEHREMQTKMRRMRALAPDEDE